MSSLNTYFMPQTLGRRGGAGGEEKEEGKEGGEKKMGRIRE